MTETELKLAASKAREWLRDPGQSPSGTGRRAVVLPPRRAAEVFGLEPVAFLDNLEALDHELRPTGWGVQILADHAIRFFPQVVRAVASAAGAGGNGFTGGQRAVNSERIAGLATGLVARGFSKKDALARAFNSEGLQVPTGITFDSFCGEGEQRDPVRDSAAAHVQELRAAGLLRSTSSLGVQAAELQQSLGDAGIHVGRGAALDASRVEFTAEKFFQSSPAHKEKKNDNGHTTATR